MLPRLLALYVLAILVLLPPGCSDNTTTQPEDELPAESGFRFEYETDDALAVSTDITPAGGQTLDWAAADGTAFSLAFAPGVVSQLVTITVTPLKYLRITRIDPVSGSASAARADTQLCHVGAMFEPAGLALDSTVVLTVTFPDTADCDVTDGLRVIYIDPDRTFYSIVPTEVDVGAASLACTLSHFSMYGTNGVTYEYLKTLIEETTAYGLEFPSLNVVTDLVHCVSEAVWGDWPDLGDLAMNGAHQVLNKLAPIVIQKALADLTHASVLELLKVQETAQYVPNTDDTIATIETGLRNIIDKMILRGKEWCGSDKEEEGRAILLRAWNYLIWGIIDFPNNEEKETEVQNAIDACSDIVINVTTDKTILYDLALNENGDDTYTGIEVEVLSNTLEPLENESVHLSMSHVGDPVFNKNIGSKLTDAEGKANFQFGYGKFYMPEGDYVVTAVVNYYDTINSGLAHIELKRVRITLTYSFTYDYSRSLSTGASTLSATYTSSGTGNALDKAGCALVDQALAQSSWYVSGDVTYSTTHTLLPLDVSACFFEVLTVATPTDDEFRTLVYSLNKLSVAMRAPTYSKMERVVVDQYGTDIDIIWQLAVDYFSMAYPADLEVFLDYVGGAFTSFSYDGQTPDGFGTGSVRMDASLSQ